jgi:hypothetical protein
VGEPAGGELQPHTAIACYSRYLCTQAGDSNDNNLLAEHRGELLQPLLEVLKVGVGHDKFVETRRLLTRAVEVVVVVAAARAEAEARADADADVEAAAKEDAEAAAKEEEEMRRAWEAGADEADSEPQQVDAEEGEDLAPSEGEEAEE